MVSSKHIQLERLKVERWSDEKSNHIDFHSWSLSFLLLVEFIYLFIDLKDSQILALKIFMFQQVDLPLLLFLLGGGGKAFQYLSTTSMMAKSPNSDAMSNAFCPFVFIILIFAL